MLVAETAQSRTSGYGRAWSSSATYTLRSHPRALYLVHTIEGGFDFTVEGTTTRAEPGQLIFFDGRATIHAQTILATARYVWFFEPTVLQPGKKLVGLHEPITLTNAPMQSLISMTNGLLNTPARHSPVAHAHIGHAVESLLFAALSERVNRSVTDRMHRDGLFTAAQLTIHARYWDPSFGVSDLAKELSVSEGHIHHVFSAMGTTPRREIERHRLEEVDRRLSLAYSREEILEQSGFRSPRHYRDAVQRALTPSAPFGTHERRRHHERGRHHQQP